MKVLKKCYIGIVTLLLLANIGSAQTASVFIDVGGFDPTSSLCTTSTFGNIQSEDVNLEYDCSFASGLDSGPYMFHDPVPTGNMIINIEVILYNTSCRSNSTISIEDAMLMITTKNTCRSGSVECGTQNESTSQSFSPSDMITYNYGGMNQFEIMYVTGGDGAFCFTHAEIVFTYESNIPTMSQWALMILGLILTSLAVVRIRKVAVA